MAERITAPVGMRHRVTNVTNLTADQAIIIKLLVTISAAQGGQRENWGVPPLPGPDGSCIQILAEAIWDFQEFWNKEGLLSVVDGVVDPDKRTLEVMNDMASIEVAPVVDVIVRFQGARISGLLQEQDVFPDALLTVYNAKKNRSIKRVGRLTNSITADFESTIIKYVEEIESLPADHRGSIIIYGSSSGGRNAVNLAAALTAKHIPIHYVAALDAAYFPQDSLTGPENYPEPTKIPRFSASGTVVSAIAESWFQRVGNHSEKTFFHGLMFTSSMHGKEVHGEIEGFTSRDLTDTVRSMHPWNDDEAHTCLIRVATPLVQTQITAILNSL